jgi:hypothetical protein
LSKSPDELSDLEKLSNNRRQSSISKTGGDGLNLFIRIRRKLLESGRDDSPETLLLKLQLARRRRQAQVVEEKSTQSTIGRRHIIGPKDTLNGAIII